MGEPSFAWDLTELHRLGLSVDNDNHPRKDKGADEPQPHVAKGGKGSGMRGGKRQATSTPQAVEAEAQVADAALVPEGLAQAAPMEAATRGLTTPWRPSPRRATYDEGGASFTAQGAADKAGETGDQRVTNMEAQRGDAATSPQPAPDGRGVASPPVRRGPRQAC